ncbi:MAG: RluA family pseudouridine synthase [Anaerovoracaceae bacterium]
MKNNIWIITPQDAGIRLDAWLAKTIEEKSRSFCQKLVDDGCVKVNGNECSVKKYKLKESDEIIVDIPEPKEVAIVSEDIPLNIVYEDEDVLVIDKVKGMVVHPAVGNYQGTMVNAIMHHCGDSLSSINGEIRPGIVHRIDKDTSGLIMVAKNDFAHNSLAKQLAEHTITRGYKAIVYNNFKDDQGKVDAPIGRNKKNRLKQAIDYENGKRAVTNYKVLEKYSKFCLIEARLETGRTHQIRVHMASINHPLLGDFVYGPEKNKYKISGQMLHAYLLGFVHPRTEEYMEFTSELPEIFVTTIEKLKKEMQ